MTPQEGLIRLARSYLWVREVPLGSNAGQAVEHFLATVGLSKGNPWCAAFVSTLGRDLLDGAWPLPLVGGCVSLAQAADKKGLLRPQPAPGALFLLHYQKLGRFAHTGICEAPGESGGWHTIEGNTSGGGSREGWGVFARTRSFSPEDRFIWWWG